MKSIMNLVVFSFLTVGLWTLSSPSSVSAQDHTRSTEAGSVWAISYARTKPGQFNAYLNDLKNVWATYLTAQMEDGDVVSYKILSVASPRDGEPNLILMVEFKNWAVFDRGPEYFEKLAKRIQGSLDNSRVSNIDRGALRDLMGGLTAVELKYMDD